MDEEGLKSQQKGRDKMNTLITWNQLREMEEAQNRVNRFLGDEDSSLAKTFGVWSSELRRDPVCFPLSSSDDPLSLHFRPERVRSRL